MAKNPRQRADQLVFEQGLAASREQARRLIMAGKVTLALNIPGAPPQLVPKPGHPYPSGTAFALLEPEPYVSRGAYKLITILDQFKLDVTGFVCLDAGASTGGDVYKRQRIQSLGGVPQMRSDGDIDGAYFVQVGAFANKANADRLTNDLARAGHKSRIRFGSNNMWNVQVGPWPDSFGAQKQLEVFSILYPGAFVVGD